MVIETLETLVIDDKHMVIQDRYGNDDGDGVDIGVWCIHRSVTCKKLGSRSKAGRCVHHGLLPTTEETPL